MGGWRIIAADIIVMASLAQIAGRYALRPPVDEHREQKRVRQTAEGPDSTVDITAARPGVRALSLVSSLTLTAQSQPAGRRPRSPGSRSR
jgi:hypothetical protein